MSEFEKKSIDEMDAADVVTAAQEADRKRVVPVEDQAEGQITEHWAAEMIREFEGDAKRWHHRQGWEAFGLGLLSCVTVLACTAAAITGMWKPIVAGIAVVNLMMTGAWWHKAKAGWSV